MFANLYFNPPQFQFQLHLHININSIGKDSRKRTLAAIIRGIHVVVVAVVKNLPRCPNYCYHTFHTIPATPAHRFEIIFNINKTHKGGVGLLALAFSWNINP